MEPRHTFTAFEYHIRHTNIGDVKNHEICDSPDYCAVLVRINRMNFRCAQIEMHGTVRAVCTVRGALRSSAKAALTILLKGRILIFVSFLYVAYYTCLWRGCSRAQGAIGQPLAETLFPHLRLFIVIGFESFCCISLLSFRILFWQFLETTRKSARTQGSMRHKHDNVNKLFAKYSFQ